MTASATSILLLGLTLAVLTVASVYFLPRYRAYRNLDFVAINQQLKLTVENVEGTRATIEKEVTIIAKKDGLKEFVHRDWSADGTFGEFKIDNEPVKFENDAGDVVIRKQFSTPVRRHDRITTTLSAVVTDSFKSTREWLTFRPTYPIKHLKVQIILPHDRPAKQAYASVWSGSEITEAADQPTLDEDGTHIEWSTDDVTDLTVQYQIEWQWPKR